MLPQALIGNSELNILLLSRESEAGEPLPVKPFASHPNAIALPPNIPTFTDHITCFPYT